MFAKQMEIADFNRNKELISSGDHFVQVHEKERKAICRTVPYYLMLNLLCVGAYVLNYYETHRIKSKDKENVDLA